MNHASRLIAAALAAVLALTAACAAESKRTESVTTTTDKGTSIAPPAKEAEKRNRALVRFVHAVPDGAAVDVFAGEAKTFPHLAYKTVTSYQELPEGQHTFRVRVSGLDSSPPLAAGGEGLSGGKHYTVITQPSTDTLTPTLRVVNDNLTPPSKGKAKVRIIHASQDAGAVDVYIKGQDQALFSGVSIQSESGYSEVEPMNATLEVHPPGQKQTVLAALSVRFDPDKIYTVIIVGRAQGAPRLEAVVVEDQLTSIAPDVTSPSSAAGAMRVNPRQGAAAGDRLAAQGRAND